MTNEPRWIIIPHWFSDPEKGIDGLQHYLDRDPYFIKNYRRLLAKDEYLNLNGHTRGILHGLWLLYAMSDGRLREDTHFLSSRLLLRVTKFHLTSLNHAGFIEFSASKPVALSEQSDSTRATRERKRESKKELRAHAKNGNNGSSPTAEPPARKPEQQARIETLIRNGVLVDVVDLEAELAATDLADDAKAFLRAIVGDLTPEDT